MVRRGGSLEGEGAKRAKAEQTSDETSVVPNDDRNAMEGSGP